MMRSAALLALLAVFVFTPSAGAAEAPGRGSLLVRLFSDDRVPLAKAEVEVLRPQSVAPRPAQPRTPAVLSRGTTDEKGWVTLEKIPPGAVILQVLPPGRKQPWVSERIEVREGERSVVDDLIVPSSSELVVHLDLSESVREHLSAGRIEAIRLYASSPPAKGMRIDTTETTAKFDEVLPGKWRVAALMVIGGKTYILDPPRGVEVEVAPGTRIDQTIPVSALVFAGRVTLRDEPF